ncbi:MAG TPA: PstS family phosphate ABC transporter substrate-binding protein [Candidatus Polarisedimenticolia bacterium]|nr:PstS family phosphate ABC transporter substrate-binding protein [Candidatus Polarisedimenticolia bacterium]
MKDFGRSFMGAAVLTAAATAAAAQAVKVDGAIPRYTPGAGVSGSLKSVGSDTMNNEMTLWAEGFRKFYPNVKIEIEGKGSSTAPPALTEGTAQFGPMSRDMKAEEMDRFEARHGYKPAGVRTSIDMLAVYVHKDNPVACLSLQQVDAIFSKTRRGGAKSDIRTWGDAGATGEWASRPISLYGRNSASGTYGFFKENALFKGDYKDSVKEQPGSSSVVQGVASDKGGIGYSGIGYKTADVKAVALSAKTGDACYEASPEHALDGRYPLARFLYVYVNAKPGEALDPLRREFLKYVLSQEGQEAVVKDGYLPLPADIVAEERKKLGL